MAKVAGKAICNQCGSGNTECLGGVHYVKTGGGFGHEKIEIGYKCKSCNAVWHE